MAVKPPLYRCDHCGASVPIEELYRYTNRRGRTLILCKHCAETTDEWDFPLKQITLRGFLNEPKQA